MSCDCHNTPDAGNIPASPSLPQAVPAYTGVTPEGNLMLGHQGGQNITVAEMRNYAPPDGVVNPSLSLPATPAASTCVVPVPQSSCVRPGAVARPSSPTSLPAEWLRAQAATSMTLLGRNGQTLSTLAGTGYVFVKDGLASVVDSVTLKVVDLWHTWTQATPVSPAIPGPPKPAPYLVVGDADGGTHLIRGPLADDGEMVWDKTLAMWVARPLTDRPVCVRGRMNKTAAGQIAVFEPYGTGDETQTKCVKALCGEGMVVVEKKLTNPTDPNCDCPACEDPDRDKECVARVLPFPPNPVEGMAHGLAFIAGQWQWVQGTSGEVGPQGLPGAQGAPGLQGIQGPAGAQGDPGVAGPPGADGAPGAQGIQGLPGAAGAQGNQGNQGMMGPPGGAGPQGAPGAQGIQGPAGPAGPPGPIGSLAALGSPTGLWQPVIGWNVALGQPEWQEAGVAPSLTFVHTGAPEIFTVPARAAFMRIQAWGAGGGEEVGIQGGTGGYTTATVPVVPGTQYSALVGAAGLNSPEAGAGSGLGFGGAHRNSPTFSAGGGGLSGVFTGITAIGQADYGRALAIAGGGAGASSGLYTGGNDATAAALDMFGQTAVGAPDGEGGGGGGFRGGARRKGGRGFAAAGATNVTISQGTVGGAVPGNGLPEYAGLAGESQKHGRVVVTFLL